MTAKNENYNNPFDTKLSLRDPRVRVIAGALVVAFCLVAVDSVFLLVKRSHLAANTGHPAVVQLTAAGFIPATLAVKSGTQIIWRNADTAPHQVASNPYPTDTSVPGLHSDPILPGSSYAFTASTLGTIHYHDQSNPSVNGTITVEN